MPQCWRFETTQRGRKREHYQWNMDIIGCKGINAEVELLAAIVLFFKNIGITSKDIGLKINSRKVMGAVLKSMGVTDEQFAPVCVVMDKFDKIGPEETQKELRDTQGLDADTAKKLVDCLLCKSVDDLAALCGEGVDRSGVDELKRLFELADAYGFGDWLVFDASVVRGLAYYTGVVFEGFDRLGELTGHLRRRQVRPAPVPLRRRAGSARVRVRVRRLRRGRALEGQGDHARPSQGG